MDEQAKRPAERVTIRLGKAQRDSHSHGGHAGHGAHAHGAHSHGAQSHGAHSHGAQSNGAESHSAESHSSKAPSSSRHGAHAHGSHAHGLHSHGAHGGDAVGRVLALTIALNSTFVAAELWFGTRFGSTALMADAVHNLGDVLSLVLAWFATRLARREPSERRTYGFRRATVLAALSNAVLLLVAIGAIGWEAITRFTEPHVLDSHGVAWVAGLGVLINGTSALLLAAGRRSDVNLRAAFQHMAADAGISLGVVVAALLVGLTGMVWIDAATSLGIAGVIAVGTWGLLRESVDLALDAVPPHIEPAAVRDYLTHLPGVLGVHDLHIWSMSTTEHALTAHLVIEWAETPPSFLACLDADLAARFDIAHATVQLEPTSRPEPCRGLTPGAL